MSPGIITIYVTNKSGYVTALFTENLSNATWVTSPTDIPKAATGIFQATSIIDSK